MPVLPEVYAHVYMHTYMMTEQYYACLRLRGARVPHPEQFRRPADTEATRLPNLN